MKSRIVAVLLSALLVLGLVVLSIFDPLPIASAQATGYGHIQAPYLDRGWHDIIELVERGIATEESLWNTDYKLIFAYHGCGFTYQYVIIPESTEQIYVYIDGILADQFDGTGKLSESYTEWVETSCSIHKVIIGTRTGNQFRVYGVDIW